MKARGYADVKCPMCGHINKLDLNEGEVIFPGKPFVTLCYPEDGGCDNYFVVVVHMKITAAGYAYQDYVVKE